MTDMNDLLHRKEDLIPELQECVEELEGFTALRHPLVVSVPYMPQMNAMLNYAYKCKKEQVQELMKAGKAEAVLVLVERPFRLQWFITLQSDMTGTQYWK